jgi:hypothetical protein
MAVALKLGFSESNDAKTVRFTDLTGEYTLGNPTGWGTPNELVSNIVAVSDLTVGKYHLYLNITVKDSDSVDTIYDPIDLYTEFVTQFTETSGMIFDIQSDHLGLAEELELPDGMWTVEYLLTEADTETEINSITYQTIVVGGVTKKVANALLTAVYGIERGINEENWGDMKRAITKVAYLQGLNAYPSISKFARKLNILKTLENYTIND